MPIYEFRCKSCGDEFDKLTSSDWRAAGVACSACDSIDLERVVSRTGGFNTGGKAEFANPDDACQSCCSYENGCGQF